MKYVKLKKKNYIVEFFDDFCFWRWKMNFFCYLNVNKCIWFFLKINIMLSWESYLKILLFFLRYVVGVVIFIWIWILFLDGFLFNRNYKSVCLVYKLKKKN